MSRPAQSRSEAHATKCAPTIYSIESGAMMVGVYIFHIIGMDLYKIGWSRDISRRLEDVSKAMPFEVEQIAAWEQSEVAVVLESRLHNLFPEKRVKREWFRLTDDDISQCKQ